MTIYDQDYVAELSAQEEAQASPNTGVMDPVAEDQEPAGYQMGGEDLEEEVVEEQPESDKELNFKALREELAYIKEERDRLRQEFRDYQRLERREPEAPRERYLDKIADDDIVTGAQLKQSLKEKEAAYQQKLQDQELYLQELKVRSQFPDYDEVIAKYGVPLIENEPDLAQGFVSAGNKAAFLYKIGKMAMNSQAREEVRAPDPRQKAERIVENSKKPGTLSNPVGGAGTLSKVDYIASMSDEQFAALIKKNLEEI